MVMNSFRVGTLGRKTGIKTTARPHYVAGLGMRTKVMFILKQQASTSMESKLINDRHLLASLVRKRSAMVYVGCLGLGGTHLLQSKNKEQLFCEFKASWSRTYVGWHLDCTLHMHSKQTTLFLQVPKVLGIFFYVSMVKRN